MNPVVLFPLRMLGWAAAGLALGVGWKLGSHLVDVAMGEKDLLWPWKSDEQAPDQEGDQPLWKRKFDKVS